MACAKVEQTRQAFLASFAHSAVCPFATLHRLSVFDGTGGIVSCRGFHRGNLSTDLIAGHLNSFTSGPFHSQCTL